RAVARAPGIEPEGAGAASSWEDPRGRVAQADGVPATQPLWGRWGGCAGGAPAPAGPRGRRGVWLSLGRNARCVEPRLRAGGARRTSPGRRAHALARAHRQRRLDVVELLQLG